ncbi:facilitated trehalose transporter Tret1-like [Bombus flavifrons]|uniref:facilitated trehalose transporter Tret1-like n=1 Tax=Bombus flavifrons TaxID=103934 RepID=UPI00370376FE
MGLVGTVHGWTKTSLFHLTSGSDDVPLTLTQDEYSWIVFLTVLGSMIGSLLAAQLADHSGRKFCLLVCSTMFSLGWFIIYVTISHDVPLLYFAGLILGIGVGIAHTINPMFVSEVADIKYRASVGVLIAANVNSGTLLTYALAIWLTYKSQLVILVIISVTSILSISRFPETPYILVLKGQKKHARKSIAYYKGIKDPHKVKIELRALRDKVRHELHQQFGDELHQQFGDELHQQSGNDLPSQSRSDLPSQSKREAHSDSFWEVVDTEHMSDLSLNSSSDSSSESISVIHSEVICQRPSASEIDPPSTSGVHRPYTSEIHPLSTSDVHRPSTSEVHRPSTSEVHPPSTSEIHQPFTSEIHRPSTSQILPQTESELDSRSRSDLCRQCSVDSRASTDITETYIGETKYTCLNKLRAILQRSNRKALFIMFGLIMAQQLSGNFTATQYLEELIDRKAAYIDLREAMILVQVARHVSGYTIALIVEYFRRRTLLFLSTVGSCISFFLVAGYLFLDLHKSDNSTISILPVCFLSWYQVLFQVGLGMLPNVLLCELFPTELKGFVAAIVVIFDVIIGFTASKLNKVIADNVEWHWIFFIFAISCSLAFLMVFIWVPETRGKTYCEIEALLVGENLNSLNEEVRTDEMDIRRI